jgi:membrane protein YdbS with pleckstrin-like domain
MKEQKKDRLGLAKANYLLLLVALVIMTAGYIIMGQNEIAVSPIMLVIAYVVVVPLSLIIKFKKKD